MPSHVKPRKKNIPHLSNIDQIHLSSINKKHVASSSQGFHNQYGSNYNSVAYQNNNIRSGAHSRSSCNVSNDIGSDNRANIYTNATCKKCGGSFIGDNGRGEYVCYECGRICGQLFEGELSLTDLGKATYKRIFYFNERLSRWVCSEPAIADDIWDLIFEEAEKPEYGDIQRIDRPEISKILRNVILTEEMMLKHQSKKFKKTLLTKKRFYDKYFEKWKTIKERLTGNTLKKPSDTLIKLMKQLFIACQIPFDKFKHASNCDGRHKCDKYFDCWHNFINYDFTIRKLLQIAEIKFGHNGCYNRFKDEFPLVSQKIRDKKLRPMFLKIASYNNWPCINNE